MLHGSPIDYSLKMSYSRCLLVQFLTPYQYRRVGHPAFHIFGLFL